MRRVGYEVDFFTKAVYVYFFDLAFCDAECPAEMDWGISICRRIICVAFSSISCISVNHKKRKAEMDK